MISTNRNAGLWIDHREAEVVFVGEGEEVTRRIESGMEKHVRFSGGNRPEDGSADDQRDRRYLAHLNGYYDEVISCIRDAKSVLIFGPGEAKHELKNRLERDGLATRIVAIEAADKMTVPQIQAKVREHFLK